MLIFSALMIVMIKETVSFLIGKVRMDQMFKTNLSSFLRKMTVPITKGMQQQRMQVRYAAGSGETPSIRMLLTKVITW